MKKVKRTIFILLVCFVPFFLLMGVCYFPVVDTVVSEQVYKQILEDNKVLKGLNGAVARYTGMGRLYHVDKRLYFAVRGIISAELKKHYISEIIRQWLQFLTGKSKKFRPILKVHKTRNRIYSLLLYAVKVDKRIPAVFRKQAISILNREFGRVPAEIDLFRLVKISRRSESGLRRARDFFLRAYRFYTPLIITTLLLLLSILLLSEGKLARLSAVGFIGVTIGGTILLFLLVFREQVVALLHNMLSYIGYDYPESRQIVRIIAKHIMGRMVFISTVLFLLSLVPLTISMFKKKGSEKEEPISFSK